MSDLQKLMKLAKVVGALAGVLAVVYIGICIYTVFVDNVGTA